MFPSQSRAPLFALLILNLLACGRARPFEIAKADPQSRRKLPAGEIVGGEGRYGAYAWLGIPFAEPPVGDLRWRAPRAAKPWAGLREALRFGAPCPQFASEFGGVEGPAGTVVGSEDCLTLNVYSPKLRAGELPAGDTRLPVMVWIHGGGNSIGTANFFDGGNLAVSGNVMVVTVQYRLGGLGWFRHAALRSTAADDLDRSGNYGTLDQLQALRWVRENIGSFGGNPGNVTIFGESAGGQNVYSLLISPPARGLFHRAIIESGLLECDPADRAENLVSDVEPGHAKSSSEILLELLAMDLGGDRKAARTRMDAMDAAQANAYLRAKGAADFLAAYHPKTMAMVEFPQVFSDGTVIRRECRQAVGTAGAWNQVPVLVGTNRDEMRLFLFANPHYVKRYLGLWPRLQVPEKEYLFSAGYQSRWWKATGADEPAMAMTGTGAPVFVYRFDWDEEPKILGADISFFLGAAHGLEIPFVFGHFDLGTEAKMLYPSSTDESRAALAKKVMQYWAAFARNGDPGYPGAVTWTPWGVTTATQPGHFMVLDTPSGGGVRMERGTETTQRILDDLVADTSQDLPVRCNVLAKMAGFSRGAVHAGDEKRLDCGAGTEISPIDY